jgi:hypothetical protein
MRDKIGSNLYRFITCLVNALAAHYSYFFMMRHLCNLAWLFILLGLALTTMGWAMKLRNVPLADAWIVVGTSLVLLFGALALWQLVLGLDVGLRGPLGAIAAGLLISVLAYGNLTATAVLGLALAGGLLAAMGTAWLLVRLHRALESPVSGRRHKYPI